MKNNKFIKKSNARLNIVAGLSRDKQIDSARPERRLTFQFQLMDDTGESSSKQLAGTFAERSTPTRRWPHILLVDDDAYMRTLNARVLTWSGYKVQIAANGAEAWKALELHNYDLLITENVMPWVTGVQLLKHLRSRGVTMPVIMASKTAPAKELKLHPGLRLEAALRKPVTGDKLLQTVKNVLQTVESTAFGCQPDQIKDRQLPQTKALIVALPPAGANLRKRILFVDDEPLIRQLHKEVLSDVGYAVELAENGAVAWDALQADKFDLLITDHEMPKLTGVELLEKLHAAGVYVPTIMVSGTMPTQELKRHQWPLVEATLNKPYAIGDLLNTVKNILAHPKVAAINSPQITLVESAGSRRRNGGHF
jgi:DNA-binding NtrC family response regulator